MRSDRENLIVELSMEFALLIIDYCEVLEEKRKFVISHQLLKAGTSIGANINEAQNAESKTDFIHKLKIAAKEADETSYWLKLCRLSDKYPNPGTEIFEKFNSVNNVLSKIISTSKRKTDQITSS